MLLVKPANKTRGLTISGTQLVLTMTLGSPASGMAIRKETDLVPCKESLQLAAIYL